MSTPLELGSGIEVRVEPPTTPAVRVTDPPSATVAVLPVAGPPGPAGGPGPAGPRGPAGLTGGESYDYTQETPATVWGPIEHNLGRLPAAWSLFDTDGRECGQYVVQHLDLNTLRVSMDTPTAGVIRLI